MWTNVGLLIIGHLRKKTIKFEFRMSAKWLPFCLGLDVLTCHIAIPCIAEHEVVEKIKLSHSFHKVFVVIVSTAKWGVFCEYKVCPDSKGHGADMGPSWVLSAPAGPHEPCYLGGFCSESITVVLSFNITPCCNGTQLYITTCWWASARKT